MGFFDDLPLPEPDAEEFEEPDQPEWMGPRHDRLGVTVALDRLLLHTDEIAVAVTRFVAHRRGVEFSLQIRWRRWRPSRIDPFDGRDRFNFGVQVADGRKARADAMLWEAEPGEGDLSLISGGGSYGGPAASQEMWLWPLPPPGPMRFGFEWPSQGVPETVAEIDASPLVEAAARAVELWP